MPQSVHKLCYCGVQTLSLKMHYGGEKLGKIGKGVVGFSPVTNLILLFRFQTTVQSFIKID